MLRVLAIRTLGPGFVTELEVLRETQLIQNGVYRFIRHPSETANLTIVAGACVLLESPAAAALGVIVLLPLICRRVREEDRFLESVFAERFRAYASRTGRLLPLV